jgi:hypothetical protein
VLGDDGAPPFVVRWQDDGHVSRLYPGSDAYVEQLHPPGRVGGDDRDSGPMSRTENRGEQT